MGMPPRVFQRPVLSVMDVQILDLTASGALDQIVVLISGDHQEFISKAGQRKLYIVPQQVLNAASCTPTP